MSILNTKEHYGTVAKFLHWSIAILVLIMLSGGFFMDDLPPVWKGSVVNFHKLIGLCILILMLARIFWLMINPRPQHPLSVPRWQSILSHSIHGLLYVFVTLMPLSGWIMSTAATKYPHIGTWQFILPGLPASKNIAGFFFECHEIIAWILIVLISLHILAAVKHALIDHDQLFQRMWPNHQS